jgi:hypothetical protein
MPLVTGSGIGFHKMFQLKETEVLGEMTNCRTRGGNRRLT